MRCDGREHDVVAPLLGGGDVRTDVPLYTVYRDGEAAGTRTDLLDVWREDLVTFALGCSFTFEAALQEAGFGAGQIQTQDVERDDVAPGTVVETDPAAGQDVGSGDTITLVVAVPTPAEEPATPTAPTAPPATTSAP